MDRGMRVKGFLISIMNLMRCLYFGYAEAHLIV